MSGTGNVSKKEPHAGGRPSKYNSKVHIPVAKAMARMGAIDEEVADELQVSVREVYRWKVAYPEFCQALKIGKEVADARVVDSLYKRAIGYEYEEVHDLVRDSVDGEVTEHKVVKKHMPPDVTACIYWTKNRMDEWQDVRNIKVSGSLTDALNELGGEDK